MKFAIVFDAHLWLYKRFGGPIVRGVNRRGQLCLDTLRRAIDGANAESAVFVVAGDLIDEAGPIQPQFAAAIRVELLRANNGVYLLLGNHDMTAVSDHSLAVYQHSSIQVVDEITRIDNVDLVPFHRDFTDPKIDAPVVVGHFGVFDDSFPGYMKKSQEAWHVARLFAFMRERDIRCCLLGDWHARYLWCLSSTVPTTALPAGNRHRSTGRPKADQGGWQQIYRPADTKQTDLHRFSAESLIMQGGCLNPTGFDNKGLHGYGTLAIIDTDIQTLSWRELPGPRFCTVHEQSEEEVLVAEAKELGHQLFLRRYYDGVRPEKPAAVENYEALPVALQQKAKLVLNIDSVLATERFESLVSEWLDNIRATLGEGVTLYEQLLKKYL